MEDYIIDQYEVDTMGDFIMEAIGEKMVRYVMTLILDLGSNMKWMMKLTLCMIPLKKNQR